ncbi:MAG: DNA gyrase/topoisomerase IV subunit A [Fibrobacterales bacterium]
MTDKNQEELDLKEIAADEINHELSVTDNKHVEQLYEEWFLDYASYVILDRAVPYFEDGLKPVQRRILHSFWEKSDGRYHKIANIIGHTMQYHPHGDASIGDAIVTLGQKDLLIDPQGNWGNIMTGDRSAAARYIEGRLTPFALEIAFNPDTTHWLPSYDGRSKEPSKLPMKFPMILAQGVKGIAVGLSTEILPHNFCELIQSSIAHLRKRSFTLYPDFQQGGIVDITNYKSGERGGKVKVRAKIEQYDKKTLSITEVPFGTTTTSLIDSIVSANDKSKIKIKKVEDNTASEVEILIHLAPGIDPVITIEALYAFTDCEVSISTNCCIIRDDKPVFTDVQTILKQSTEHTVSLLEWELKNRRDELNRKWHLASLEKIFIEKKVYLTIEEAKSREEMITFVDDGLKPHTKKLRIPVTQEDVLRLCEIPIRKISRFDTKKNQELLKELDDKIEEVENFLANLIDYSINYFKGLLTKYGKGRERKTEIEEFQTLSAKQVAVANQRLYVSKKEGFVGTSLKKDEYVFDCSPYDELIVFKKDATFMVTKVDKKVYVGKDIIHIEIFHKEDDRTTYNYIYEDGTDKRSYIKRFNVTGITRNKDYPLAKSAKSKVLYFSSNPNGEAEVVEVTLKPQPRIKLAFKVDFSETEVKARGAKGNTVTKHPVKKIKLLKAGTSTLEDQTLFYDSITNVVSNVKRGEEIGAFSGDDLIMVVRVNGRVNFFAVEASVAIGGEVLCVKRYDPEAYHSAIYYEGNSLSFYVKRFDFGEVTAGKDMACISDNKDSVLLYFSNDHEPKCLVEFAGTKKRGASAAIEIFEFADEELYPIRGIRALGTRITAKKIKKVLDVTTVTPKKNDFEEVLKKVPVIQLKKF